jgi:hypothetical protein
MKARVILFAAFILSFSGLLAQSDSLGMSGDNLDLKAVLAIFKESENTEEFEKKLNAADSKVNNLDLNGDGQVDYLRVIDTKKDDVHSLIIQAPVSKSESQDVAVIQIEKKGKNKAHLQIVGDETLYGKNYIIEPGEETASKEKTKKEEKEANEDDVYAGSDKPVVVNVWTWAPVVYLYSPGYTMWVSPWYWGYYPPWYSPWAPYPWNMYHTNIIGYSYLVPCRYGNYYYSPRAQEMYYGKRTSSGYVEKTTTSKYGARDYPREQGVGKQNRPDENKIKPRSQEKINSSERNSNKVERNNNPAPQQNPGRIQQPSSPANPNPRGGGGGQGGQNRPR